MALNIPVLAGSTTWMIKCYRYDTSWESHCWLNRVLLAWKTLTVQFACGRIAHSSRICSPQEPVLECYRPVYLLECHRIAMVLSGPRWDLPRGRRCLAGRRAHSEDAQKVALKSVAVEKGALSYGRNSWERQRCVALVRTS